MGGRLVGNAVNPPSSRAKRTRAVLGVETLEAREVLSGNIAPLSYVFTPIPDGAPLVEHIHPHLKIVVNGVSVAVPALIGQRGDAWLPLHTHDASGLIHIESTVNYKFTLGEFFAAWGQKFSRTDVLGVHADKTHKITMTVDGRPSNAFGSLVMKDLQQIVIKVVNVGRR
jgi:hypothetical protein